MGSPCISRLSAGATRLILPVSVALAGAAYHLVLASLGISVEAARAEGLLLTSTADGSLWPALFPADLVHVQWVSMAEQAPYMLTLILVAFICVIMNFAGLELATNQELDWDREFRVTGVASMVAWSRRRHSGDLCRTGFPAQQAAWGTQQG